MWLGTAVEVRSVEATPFLVGLVGIRQSSWGWSGYDQVDVGVVRFGSHDWE